MCIGIDLGNWSVKTSNKDIFQSRYSTVEGTLDHTGDVLEHEGIKYYMEKGKLENNYDKASKVCNKILFLHALSIQKQNCFKVVVGLPVLSYKNNRDKFRSDLLENKIHDIKLNGILKRIIIEDLIVFPEGAGVYFSQVNKPKNQIIIDIGGGTTNIVYFKNNKLHSCNTIPNGSIKLYNKIREYLNSEYTLRLEVEDIEDILKSGLIVDGNKVNFSFIRSVIEKFTEDLMNELRNFPIRTTKTLLSGGGSTLLKSTLAKKIVGLEVMEDYLFANVIGFKKVGDSKWKE